MCVGKLEQTHKDSVQRLQRALQRQAHIAQPEMQGFKEGCARFEAMNLF